MILDLLIKVKEDVFQSVTQAYSDEKKNWSAPNRSQTYDLLIISLDARQRGRRLVVARPLNYRFM